MAALWPERVKSLVSVSGYLIGSQHIGAKPLPPQAELSQYWPADAKGKLRYTAFGEGDYVQQEKMIQQLLQEARA